MNKKERAAHITLLNRCVQAETRAQALSNMAAVLFAAMREEIVELIQEEIDSAVSDLQITI